MLCGCEVVLVHNMLTMPFDDVAARRLALLSREVRMVNWVHDVDVGRDWFEGLGLRARHVAVSKMRGELMRERLGLEEVEVIPNGVDVAGMLGWSERVKRLKLLERELVLFHPARVLARKNVELGVRVIGELRRRGVDALGVVSGAADPHRVSSGEYGREVRALVEESGLERDFVFLADGGEVGEDEVRMMYEVADLVWFPSKSEGFGLPLVEAALVGVPVLCSDIAVHREVAEGMSGVEFFDLGESVEVLAERVLGEVERFGEVRRERRRVARRYDWERIYEDYLEPLLKKG